MVEFPKPNKFILSFTENIYGTTYECEPDNWADIEMGLSRKGLGVIGEITNEFVFSGIAGKIIKLIFETDKILTMDFYKRQNDMSYLLFHTYTTNFTEYSWDGKAHITFSDNQYFQDLENNKGTDYTFTVPDTLKMLYSGVSSYRTNTIKAIEAEMSLFTGSVLRILKGARIQSDYTLYHEFNPSGYSDSFIIRCIRAKTSDVKTKLGSISFRLLGTPSPTSQVRLYKISGVTATVIRAWDSTNSVYDDGYTVLYFSDGEEYTDTVSMLADDYLVLALYNTVANTGSIYEGSSTMSLITFEESNFQDLQVNAVTHEWLLGAILDKINPNIELTYNLPKNSDSPAFTTLLVSATSLTRQTAQTITCSFENIMKSLRCIYGADYKFLGQSLTVDYPYTFFSGTKAMDVIPINEPVFSANNEHVYNKVTVGWDTDDDIDSGSLEFNCKNVFSLNTKRTNELELIHPFKGSMYTIEQYLRDKQTNSSKTDNKDTDIFIFAVSHYTTVAELYRDFTSVDIPTTAFNVPLSPMRMLIANAAYLGISTYDITPQAIFLSTDRKADITTQCGYEADIIEENNGVSTTPLGLAMATPLFLPIDVELKTPIKLWTLADINDNLYNYFEYIDLKTKLTHKFYINDISLRLTKVNSQSWIGIYGQ